MEQEFQDKIRLQINRFIFSNGYAPTIHELSLILSTDENAIKDGLKQLADNHAIVLHPNSFDIWVAHPFALFPTLFWVESGGKKWWGNCSWCSLGIAALTKTDTKIFTKLSGEKETLIIEIVDGKVIQGDLMVHFPIPAWKFWDNVIFTCANMLTFKDEAQVDEWCHKHKIAKGEVHPLDKVWELAKLWYSNYLDESWTRKSPEYAETIFKTVGLTSEFWKLK
jgi:hypothetical protein